MSVCDLGTVHFKYILTVMDVLSKFAWVELIKTKTGENFVKAFEKIVRKVENLKHFPLIKEQSLSRNNFKNANFLEGAVSTIH